MINKVSFPYVFALIISVEATNVIILMESNFFVMRATLKTMKTLKSL